MNTTDVVVMVFGTFGVTRPRAVCRDETLSTTTGGHRDGEVGAVAEITSINPCPPFRQWRAWGRPITVATQ